MTSRSPAHTPFRCLVIGGGLLGSRTAVELASRGHHTGVLSRSVSPWFADQDPARLGIAVTEAEISPEVLEQLLPGVEVVFLMAGSSTPAKSDAHGAVTVRDSVLPAVTVLDAMCRAGSRRLVMASSGGTVYGPVETVPTPETHPTRPISLHGMNALAMEQYAGYYGRRHALETVILRFSNIFGPGQRVRGGQGVLAAWTEALADGRPIQLIGDGGTRRDMLFAADAADAAADAAALAPPASVYNVGAGMSWTLEDLAGKLAAIAGREPEIERLPGRPVDVPITHLDVSRIESEIGWQPATSLTDGLQASWNFLRLAVGDA